MRRPRYSIVGALALALAVLLLAAPAQAKLRIGVHAQNSLTNSEIDRMAEGGTEAVRLIFRWSEVEPAADAAQDWTRLDAVMRATARHKVDVIPILVGTPTWAKDDPSATTGPQGAEAWPTTVAGAVRLQQWIQAVVRRYGRGGSFWPANTDVPYHPVTDYQVWNEPNRPLFSPAGHPVPSEYARLLDVTSRTVKGVDRKANILLAGMPERTTTSKPLDVYLKRLYKVKGVEKDFDVMTLHPYGIDHRGVEGAIIRMRKLLKRVHDKKRDLWLTEVGWGSGGSPSPFTKKAVEQRDLLKDTFELLEKKRKKYRLGTVIWFSWRDLLAPGNQGEWQDHTGLFNREGKAKPAWEAYVDQAGGKPGSGDLDDPLGIPLGRPDELSGQVEGLLASPPAE
jgi:polysaccharide biosynthesis protein PslG